MPVKLVAREKFYYSGRNLAAGEEFDALDQDVALLTASHSPRARRPDSKPKQEQSESTAAEPMKVDDASAPKRRLYQRRDMRARE